jgi:hypothetical protein
MGLEPTTLPREVAPSAHDFPRPAVSPPDVTDSEQKKARSGKARPRFGDCRRWLMGLEPTTTWTTTRGSTN